MIIQRNTVQRQIVLSALKRLKIHPCIDEIYYEINRNHPAISKSTVYRNLRQLASNGIIRQVSLPDGLERYDGNPSPHYHFRCKSCGGIYDLEVDYLTGINDIVQSKYDFQVDEHDIVFSGVCEKCKHE